MTITAPDRPADPPSTADLRTGDPLRGIAPLRITALGPARDEWVSAAPFRAHVRHLAASSGVPWRVLAWLAGVSPVAVRHLLQGRDGRVVRRLDPTLARRLFILSPEVLDALRQTFVPADAAARQLGRLHQLGWERGELSARLQVGLPVIDELLEHASDLEATAGGEPADAAEPQEGATVEDAAPSVVCSRLTEARIMAGAQVLSALPARRAA